MKLKDEYLKLPKEMLYETYLKIVYKPKDYDNITRNKMLEEIIKEYNQENYLYHICTRKELDFLKYISKNKLSVDDIKKYEWEIKILNEKCIFSRVTLEVFEEQKQNVQDALKTYEQNNKKGIEDLIIFMISKVKTNAIMLTKVLTSMIESMYNIDEKGINSIMGSPLFHFYCEFNYEFFDFSKQEEELVSYRDYYNILDELKESRKIYGIAGSIPFDIRDDFDTFYYGFPIRKEKIKKMYNEINKRVDKEFLFQIIDEARVLNNRMGLDTFMDNRLLEVVNEALDECPCAAMNGFTPNEYNNQLYEELDLDKEFSCIPQNNAHLCKNAADHYYKLYFALLDYINKKYKIHPEIKKIYKQEGIDVNKIYDIDKYLWKHKEIIGDFIKDNDYKFTEEELSEINKFKNAITSDYFVIVGFDREYTKILSDDGKLYMVKGIRADFDKIMNPKELPTIISTTLLMFNGNIVFKSFFGKIDIVFGNDVKKDIVDKMKCAIVHYHL